MSYFGTDGLTMVSANYVANRAKEKYEALEAKLNATSFIGEKLTIIGSTEPMISKNGTPAILDEAEMLLNKVTGMKSLIAFLREAIKEKNAMLTAVKTHESDALKEHSNNVPKMERVITESEVIASMSTGDREKYLSLETKCAVIGKYIHPDGPFSRAKTKLANAIQDPVSAELKGRDTIVREYFPVRTIDEVEALFFRLQKEHRESQAELNGIKHKIDVQIREDESKKSEAYHAAYAEYYAIEKKLQEENRKWKEEELKRIEDLKIVIPNRLRAIYDEVMAE